MGGGSGGGAGEVAWLFHCDECFHAVELTRSVTLSFHKGNTFHFILIQSFLREVYW